MKGRYVRRDERAKPTAGMPVNPAVDVELRVVAELAVLANTAPLDEVLRAVAVGLALVNSVEGPSDSVWANVFRFVGSTQVRSWASSDNDPKTPPSGAVWDLNDGSVLARLLRTETVSRVDGLTPGDGTLSRSSDSGFTSAVSAPIFVEGRLWGAATLFSKLVVALRPETERQVEIFARLATAAVSSAERTRQLQEVLDEQATRQELAVMIADGAEPQQLFDAVTAAAGRHCGAAMAGLLRFDDDRSATSISMWSETGPWRGKPTVWPRADDTMGGRVTEPGVAVRVDDWSTVTGLHARGMREKLGIGGSVAAPVLAGGRLWGIVIVHSRVGDTLPRTTEARLLAFAELVTSAIANAAARTEIRRLADEQEALRRIATFVASQPAPEEVHGALVAEVARFPGIDDVRIVRFASDLQAAEVMASRGVLRTVSPVGYVAPLAGTMTLEQLARTGEVVRVDRISSRLGSWPTVASEQKLSEALGCPIRVGDRLWGALEASSRHQGSLSEATVGLLVQGAALIATAVANAEARESVRASRERLVTVADAARRRFERDLHDSAQQRLVAVAVELRAPPRNGALDARAIAAEIDEIIEEVRTLARGIHPAVLSQGGLFAALRGLARRASVPVRLDAPRTLSNLGEAVEVAVYYAVSEALVNIAKHAAASEGTITVKLGGQADPVVAVVTDDGRGGAMSVAGGGLQGIADRIEALGGTVELRSPPGSGTVITVTLPRQVPANRDQASSGAHESLGSRGAKGGRVEEYRRV